MQETALWIPRGAFCPLEGGPRHIGTDTLAPVLQCKFFSLNVKNKFEKVVGGGDVEGEQPFCSCSFIA